MKKLFIITGASGVGKTTAVKNIQKDNNSILFFFFDTIGVPSTEEMEKDFGGPEEWQKITTKKWVKKIKTEVPDDTVAVLDGQIRPSFIDEACKEEGVTDYEVVLFDCIDEERIKRLNERGQGNLATQDMMNWAKYLREESASRGYTVIDNTTFTQEQSAQALKSILAN